MRHLDACVCIILSVMYAFSDVPVKPDGNNAVVSGSLLSAAAVISQR